MTEDQSVLSTEFGSTFTENSYVALTKYSVITTENASVKPTE
jgi:hypothetical protein